MAPPSLQAAPGPLAAATESTEDVAISCTPAVAVQRLPGAAAATATAGRKPGEHAAVNSAGWSANHNPNCLFNGSHSCRRHRMLLGRTRCRSSAATAACRGAGAQQARTLQPAPQQQQRIHHAAHAGRG